MKRILSLTACLLILVSLIACHADKDTQNTETTPEQTVQSVPGEGFRVGFGRACITPREKLPLGGFGNSTARVMEDVLDEIYVDCIALTDAEDQTMLLMLVDMQRIADEVIAQLRQSVTDATGIPGDRIIISCSHTHSIPDLTLSNHEGIARYKELMLRQFAQAAESALADSLPATLSAGVIETDQLSFVRHYYSVADDGTKNYFGDNFGTAVLDETTQHVTEGMESMRVVKFDREGGKSVVLCSFQAHPHLTGGSSLKDLSSDYVGPFREAVEWQLDVHCSFIQGTGGNLNENSKILSENMGTDVTHRQYGNRLAEYCISCIENNMKPMDTGLIQLRVTPFEAKVDHSDDSRLYSAKEVIAFHQISGSNAATREYAAQYGISSFYHASAIQLRAGMPETVTIELATFAIGDSLGFYVAPGELFAETGLEMEARSPFPMTIAVCLADGDWKYFAYGPCAEYNSYESDYRRFVPDTCASLMDVWDDALNTLHENAQKESQENS